MTRFFFDDLRAQVAEGVEREGLRPYARRLGIDLGIVRSIQDGRDVKASTLVALCEAVGYEFYVGPPRGDDDDQAAQIGDDFVPVPRLEVELSAGPGIDNPEALLVGALAFRKPWLRRLAVSPAQACLVTVRGDSMEPLLRDRDVVLIDRARTTVKTGQVYALRDGGEARVKRLDRPDPETLVLRSDNPAHPLEFRRGTELEAVTILGQVVWSGHTW